MHASAARAAIRSSHSGSPDSDPFYTFLSVPEWRRTKWGEKRRRQSLEHTRRARRRLGKVRGRENPIICAYEAVSINQAPDLEDSVIFISL